MGIWETIWSTGLVNGCASVILMWMYDKHTRQPGWMQDKLTRDLLYIGGTYNGVVAIASLIRHIK